MALVRTRVKWVVSNHSYVVCQGCLNAHESSSVLVWLFDEDYSRDMVWAWPLVEDVAQCTPIFGPMSRSSFIGRNGVPYGHISYNLFPVRDKR